ETAMPRYMQATEAKVDAEGIRKRNPMVVVDPGNGAGCVVTPYLLRSLGCRVLTLNAQPDGAFPGRLPEPTPDHLGDLMRVVSEVQADLAIAHDGAADRAGSGCDATRRQSPATERTHLCRRVVTRPEYQVEDANVALPVRRREGVLAGIVHVAKGRKVESTRGVKIPETAGAVLVRPSAT